MLIDPASKVSVPFVVVMRTIPKVAESVFLPEVNLITDCASPERDPFATQIYPETKLKTRLPLYACAAVEL